MSVGSPSRLLPQFLSNSQLGEDLSNGYKTSNLRANSVSTWIANPVALSITKNRREIHTQGPL